MGIIRQSGRFLLLVIVCFAAAYLLLVFANERNFVTFDLPKSNISCGPVAKGLKVTEEDGGREVEQVITMEEDGRLGNLLMEMATLLLIGRQVNVNVSLLPQVAEKLLPLLSPLPLPVIDHRVHCTCTKCTECICPVCTKWAKVLSGKYLSNPAKYHDPYLLIQEYHPPLVMQYITELGKWWRSLLAKEPVAIVQEYLTSLNKARGKQLTFVGVHVRRTDYIKFMEERWGMYPGNPVDHNFFHHCMREFRKKLGPDTLFLVTSDDIPWCREHLGHKRTGEEEDVVFPELPGGVVDPAIMDFILLTQTNHSIYDYGSFGFWGAVMAGGMTMVADGYSKRPHMILAAIRKRPPEGWTRVDVTLIQNQLKEQEKGKK